MRICYRCQEILEMMPPRPRSYLLDRKTRKMQWHILNPADRHYLCGKERT